MASPKNMKVSEDTQIHMTTVYSRNKKGKKSSAKRSFNFVIKGILISSTLVGAILTGGGPAFADEKPSQPIVSSQYSVTAQDILKEEVALISNLKMVTKVLNVAINRGELNSQMYSSVLEKLNNLESRIDSTKGFSSVDDLIPVLQETSKALSISVSSEDAQIVEKRAKSISALEGIQTSLGIYKDPVITSVAQPQTMVLGVSTTTASKPAVVKTAAATQIKSGTIVLNGIKSPALMGTIKNKVAYAPIRTTFEKLGAKVSYNSKTQIVSAVKGKVTMHVKVGSNIAKINGKNVNIGAKVMVHNKVTMAPTKLITSTFGGKTVVNPQGLITITTAGYKAPVVTKPPAPKPSPPPVVTKPGTVVSGIATQFGKHTYASKNQTEYNKVMGVVTTGMQNYKSIEFNNGGSLEQYFHRYLDGQRPSDFPRGSADERGLKAVDATLGILIKNGVSPTTAGDMYKAGLASLDIIVDAKAKTLTNGAPVSAYDHLFNKVTDCDAYANTLSAAMDKAGYNTAIITKPGHAEVIVKAGSNWYLMKGSGFNHVTKSWLTQEGFKVTTAPTDGSSVY